MNFIRNKLKSIIANQGSVYFEDFESKMKADSILSGKVTLKNLKLKPEAIPMDDKPFKIVSGSIGELVLNIPYSAIFTDPTVLSV